MTQTRDEILREVVREHAGLPFRYGSHDCCQFARAVVRAVMGADPWRHRDYQSLAEAEAILAEHDGLNGLLTSVLGAPVPADSLTTCDIALLRLPTVGQLTGVVSARGVIVPMPRGLETVPRSAILHGWNV